MYMCVCVSAPGVTTLLFSMCMCEYETERESCARARAPVSTCVNCARVVNVLCECVSDGGGWWKGKEEPNVPHTASWSTTTPPQGS